MQHVSRLKPLARAKTTDKPSRLAPFWQVISSLLPSIVLAAFGFFLTGRVEQALKERQVTVESVKAMTALLETLSNPELKEGKLKGPMTQLSMFGVDAIGPIIALTLSAKLPVAVAKEGLTLIAIRNMLEVCAALENTVALRDQFPSSADFKMTGMEELSARLDCRQRRGRWWKF